MPDRSADPALPSDGAIISLSNDIRAGDRRALARAITLIESTRPEHRSQSETLLEHLLPHTGNSFRLGISGVPGVGKSTFIEALGLHILGHGHKVSVLAVDPSSPKTGGSILGDKTRMEELSRHPDAFIRPSPSSGTLGGVARRTREAMLVTEAAGFDVVLVETVGVGQSETAVAGLTDMFLLLLAPGGGDDLQGIKKGIVELADLIAVNKADGDLMPAAERARRDYASALHLLRPTTGATRDWLVKVMTCSAMENSGIEDIWTMIGDYRTYASETGLIHARRADQAAAWMWDEVTESLLQQVRTEPRVSARVAELENAVRHGDMPAAAAAQIILNALNSFR